MTNRDIRHCYVYSGKEPHNSPSNDVFPTLKEAAKKIASGSKAGTREVVITFVDSPHEVTKAPSIKPKHQFFFDTQLIGMEGDGSDVDPWPSVPAALEEIVQWQDSGKLNATSGQSISIKGREIFTATALERKKKRSELLAKYIFMMMAIVLVLPVMAILGHLLYKAWPAMTWEFITQNPKNGMTEGGIWAPLVGTFFLVFVSLIVSAPIGVLAGVYLNEYAKDNWFTRFINLAVVNLAGVPSIVHALFGVGAFVLFARFGESLLAASCTLAVMTLPVIITSTREALASVPTSFREACWNMGASRWQTIRTIVLPNSISGILTGVILQVSRAAGETAPILFTGATFFMDVPDEGLGYFLPYNLGDKVMALSMHLYTLRTQINNAPEHYEYGTAVVLIGLVLVVNSFSIGLRTYLRSRKKW